MGGEVTSRTPSRWTRVELIIPSLGGSKQPKDDTCTVHHAERAIERPRAIITDDNGNPADWTRGRGKRSQDSGTEQRVDDRPGKECGRSSFNMDLNPAPCLWENSASVSSTTELPTSDGHSAWPQFPSDLVGNASGVAPSSMFAFSDLASPERHTSHPASQLDSMDPRN